MHIMMMEDPLILAISEAKEKANTNLFLNYMNLVELPEEVLELHALKRLYLKRNLLQTLPQKIHLLQGLVQLYMDSNSLSSLPDSIGELVNLKSMALNRNRLLELPDSIGNLTNLQSLHLSHNDITYLPASIGNLRYLQILNVMNNNLHHLPAELGSCVELRMLQVDCNFIRSLPVEILTLRKLEELSTSRNRLHRLPQDIDKLSALSVLTVDANIDLTLLPGKLTMMSHLELLGVNRCIALHCKAALDSETIAERLGLDWIHVSGSNCPLPLKEIALRKAGYLFLCEQYQPKALPSTLMEILQSPTGSCQLCSTPIYRAGFVEVCTLGECISKTPVQHSWYSSCHADIACAFLYCSFKCFTMS